jgi:hypothetical protein
LNIPVIEPLDAVVFRQEIAGLLERHEDDHEPDDFGDTAALLCVTLAEQFDSDTLDRLKLWDRISSGILTAAAKVDDGDLDRFLSLCLEHVKASPGRAATSDTVARLIGAFDQDEAWRIGFVRYCVSHHYPILIHGRAAWQRHKEES